MLCPNCQAASVKININYIGKHAPFRKLSLGECANCGLIFSDPMPTESELSTYYRDYWKGEVAVVSGSTRLYYLAQFVSRIHYISQFHKFASNDKILDIGAGPGLFLDALKYENITASYTAVEPDHVQQRSLLKKTRVEHVYADISEIPVTEKFDLIVLSHVLEHVSEPHLLIGKIFSLLSTNGHLFIEVPNGDHLYKNIHEPHLLFFNENSLKKTLDAHGNVINVSSVGKASNKIYLHPSDQHQSKLLWVLKEIAKMLIALLTPRVVEKQIKKFQMEDYGRDKQWLRAVATHFSKLTQPADRQ